ncbi:MAG: DUF2059 domain-containing protein [Pseudomonadota bacterium]
MSRFAVAVFASILLSAPLAMADNREEKALRVFELAMTPEIIGDMSARTGRALADHINARLALKGGALSLSQQNELIVRFAAMFNDMMTDLTPEVARIWAEEMTERELDLMIEIYDDPEMAALMSKMPVVMERILPLIQGQVPERTQELVEGMVAEGILSDL